MLPLDALGDGVPVGAGEDVPVVTPAVPAGAVPTVALPDTVEAHPAVSSVRTIPAATVLRLTHLRSRGAAEGGVRTIAEPYKQALTEPCQPFGSLLGRHRSRVDF